ncbi:UDP-N-acetylmuramoyl-tripeptide--D-alanyl-D-alanine ligase [Candidatus Microgenomates bacterium]|nr:UDP-N-acetylmuramoyl-tripeptide--D-alanyl-D-alanine ligase [Candidatus Microgenomates bacterium]
MSKDREISPLIQAWVGPHLPPEHVFIDPEKRPDDLKTLVRVYSRKWLIHPVRRHLTHRYSEILSRNGCDIIGVTGSAGKTTTKELISAVLTQKFNTKWSPGNIDPVYNIPQTVLHTPLNTEKLVLEMGIEFPGEMDYYLWLARPNTGVVTSIYWAHSEFLGSLENIVKEKGKLVELLPSDGLAILNRDDKNVYSLADRTNAQVVWYGQSEGSNVRGKNVKLTEDLKTNFTIEYEGESEQIELNLLGQHFADMALAAASVGLLSGMSLQEVKKGLETALPQEHRMNPIIREDKLTIIDDTYNANPLASKEAVKSLKEISGKRRAIFVLGEMKELGEFKERGHKEVGEEIANQGIDYVLTLGELTKHTIGAAIEGGLSKDKALYFDDKQKLIERLKEIVQPDDVLLVKGSRSMKMEEVVEVILTS